MTMTHIIGIMADSHDNIDNLKIAVNLFNSEQVTRVLHAGDIVSPFTIRVLKDLNCPLDLVFGNNDGDKLALIDFFKGKGTFHGQFADLTISGRRIAMIHGINQIECQAIASSGLFDVLVTGHTHQKETRTLGKTLLINPGETCGYLSGQSTVVLLDLQNLKTQTVNFVEAKSPLLP